MTNTAPVVPDPHSISPKDHQVREMFSQIAPTYDLLNRLLSLGVDQRWRKYAIARISRPSPAQVLDLCGGTGDMALCVKKTRPRDKVLVVDFSEAMLKKGKSRFLPSPDCCRGTACCVPTQLCGDALHLPFSEGTFDVTLCAFGVRNWINLRQGLAEVHRVLTKDGEFVILDFLKAGNRMSDKLGRFYIHQVLPLLGGIISRNRKAYQYLANSMEGFCSVEELTQIAQDSGFKVIHRKRFLMGLCWCFVLGKV